MVPATSGTDSSAASEMGRTATLFSPLVDGGNGPRGRSAHRETGLIPVFVEERQQRGIVLVARVRQHLAQPDLLASRRIAVRKSLAPARRILRLLLHQALPALPALKRWVRPVGDPPRSAAGALHGPQEVVGAREAVLPFIIHLRTCGRSVSAGLMIYGFWMDASLRLTNEPVPPLHPRRPQKGRRVRRPTRRRDRSPLQNPPQTRWPRQRHRLARSPSPGRLLPVKSWIRSVWLGGNFAPWPPQLESRGFQRQPRRTKRSHLF